MAPSPPTVTPLTARAHAFVDDLVRPRLSVGDHHHLTRVLRLSPGDAVTVGDGAGRWRAARVGTGPDLADLGEIRADARVEPPLTVAFALVKGERPELTVQKLTELGIDRIVPFEAARSVVRWDDAKAARQERRLTTIAREAAMQCRRTWLPDVARVATFADVARLPGAVRAELDGDPPSLRHPTVLVGPEGGWTPEEAAAVAPRVRIAAHVLRAETAAITVGALLGAIRGALVAEGVRSDHDV